MATRKSKGKRVRPGTAKTKVGKALILGGLPTLSEDGFGFRKVRTNLRNGVLTRLKTGRVTETKPWAFPGSIKMGNIQKTRVIRTTLGDLIAALTEEAFVVAEDENEVNVLVADMLSDLLNHSGLWH